MTGSPASARRTIALAALAIASSLAPRAAVAQMAAPDDPFIWLEDVEAKRSMDWVNAKNASTVAELTRSPLYQPLYTRIKQILDSRDRIAYPQIVGSSIYNFWQDAEHERGIWRRTSWEGYAGSNPSWETVLDIDALSKAEGVTWSFGGSDCLEPEYRLCIVSLSRGGSDAAETREFDLSTRKFVDNGFKLPEAKSTTAWVDANTLLVGTEFGPGSMTSSGYPRIIKLWKRGTPISAATTVFEVPADHAWAFAYSTDAGDRRYVRLTDGKTFYESTEYLFDNGKAVKLDVPKDASLYMMRDQVAVYVRDPWTVGGKTWTTGQLIAMPVDDFLAGKRDFTLVAQPGPRETIEGISATRDYLLINMLNNVRGELRRYSNKGGTWTFEKVPAPDLGTVNVVATSPRFNRYFFNYTTFTQPTTLYLASDEGRISEVKRLPAMFDAKGVVVEQLEATSKDGTRIPFFVVHREGMARDGNNPTLLTAYGGFESSSKPSYASISGASWIERGFFCPSRLEPARSARASAAACTWPGAGRNAAVRGSKAAKLAA